MSPEEKQSVIDTVLHMPIKLLIPFRDKLKSDVYKMSEYLDTVLRQYCSYAEIEYSGFSNDNTPLESLIFTIKIVDDIMETHEELKSQEVGIETKDDN